MDRQGTDDRRRTDGGHHAESVRSTGEPAVEGAEDATNGTTETNGTDDRTRHGSLQRAGYQQLFDGTGMPTFVLDADGVIVEWNGALAELTGVGREDAIGHEHASEHFYPDGRRADTLADKVLREPERAHREFGVERRD